MTKANEIEPYQSESQPFVLENLVIVEDAILSPSRGIQPQPSFSILPKVHAKWEEFKVDHGCDGTIESYLRRAHREPFESRLRHAFSTVLGIKPANKIVLRMAWLSENTSLWFIIADNVLVEFVTFRALRTLKAKAMHIASVGMAGMPEDERLRRIGKQKFRRQIQGGRLNQERSPRDAWKSSRKTY